MEDRRSSPEEMLARANAEARQASGGRLKIFLGAAPGVGKTYAMLEAARVRQRDGTDVVVGWVETHGRRETGLLLEGLERVPPRMVPYRGLTLQEFDLDASLARRPALLLLDELAHTNAEGSRHAKRWQDAQELLQAGIDVFTTLNIQHLESLNDVVAIVTGVAVLETVPDSVLDEAADVELVDLPPDELLQRLREGKVYIPEQADRAMAHFFRKGNLIALRELALRRLAERVDAQAVEWRRGAGLKKPWPTRDRFLVAVGPAPQSAQLVRATMRMASRVKAPWIALSVETAAFDRLPAAERERVAEHLALAEQLGAETMVVRGEHAADEILAVARARSVSRLVVGRPSSGRWRSLRPSLIDELVRGAGDIEILVTTGHDAPAAVAKPAVVRRPAPPAEFLWAALAVVVATAICELTSSFFSLADQSMIYLIAVLIAASRLARVPSMVAALLSVAALDFFFVPPHYTFDIDDLRHGVTFGVLLGAGLLVSHLTHRLREQGDAARQRERRTAALYSISRAFAAQGEVQAIAATAVQAARDLAATEAAVFVAGPAGELAVRGASAGWVAPPERELAVARWAFEHGASAGYGTDTLPGSESLYLPLTGTGETLGVLAMALGKRGEPLTPAQRQLLDTFVAQAALALERALLAEAAGRAEVAAETERTRSALLSAVSHDLRTPLASIAGTAELLASGVGDTSGRETLLHTIHDESRRLARLVDNLLDLTRLEQGELAVRKELCPVEEVVLSAVGHARRHWPEHEFKTVLPSEMLLVAADPVLLDQALYNLLENAAKYTPPHTLVEIGATAAVHEVTLEVSDRGPGLAPGDEERIFERFYRAKDGSRDSGAGLGLAICRAIAKAHGGAVRAANRPGGGASFTLTLPREPAPGEVAAADRDAAPGSGLPPDRETAAGGALPHGGRPDGNSA